MLTADQLRVKALLTETIMLLCKNGLHFKSEFSIEGLIGITLDSNEIFLVNINETVHHSPDDSNELDANQAAGSNEPSTVRKNPRKRRKSSRTPDRVLPPRPNVAEASSQMRSDPDSSRRSDDQAKWTNLDPQSAIKLEVSRSGPCQFQNHSLENVDTSGSRSEVTDSLQITNVQGSLGEWNERTVASEHATSGEFDRRLTVQEPAEPARKRLLTDSDAANATVRNQRQMPNSDDPDRSDGDVIHIKEETASDEDLSHSENSFAGYLGLYGVDASQGYAVPAADQLPMQMSADVLLPGCSSWNRRGGNVRPSSSPQTTPCSSTLLTDSSRTRLLWNRAVQGAAEDAGSRKSDLGRTGLGFRPSLVRRPIPQPTKKYSCPYCEKRFSATSNLRGHLVHHTGVKEFVCAVCKKEFQYKQALKRHGVRCFQEIPQMSFSG